MEIPQQLRNNGNSNLNDALSARERQLLVMATNGLTDHGIAHELGISMATVSTYWGRVRIKFGPLPRTELVAMFTKGEIERSTAALAASEARFRALLEASSFGILLTGPDGVPVYSNPAYEAMTGLNAKELAEQGPAVVVHPDDREEALANWSRCLQSGTPYTSEHRYLRPDGSIVWVRVRGNAWQNGDQIGGRVSVVEDVTAKHEAELSRMESEQRYKTLLALAPEAIISVDETLNITEFNPGAERIFEYASEDLIGKPLSVLLPDQYRDGHDGYMLQFGEGTTAIARPMGHRKEVFGQRQNGEIFRCEASIFRQIIRGKPIYTAIVRDTSARLD